MSSGLSFELEGLGVEVLTYQPGFIKNSEPSARNIIETILSQKPGECARVALAEMEMEPYGATCGSNLYHEATDFMYQFKTNI